MIDQLHASDMPKLGTYIKHEMRPICHLAKSAPFGHKIGMIRNNIAVVRKRAGLSQTELAERIGTTLNMMGKLERGARSLDTAWMEKIARALGVQPYELIGPVELPAPEEKDAPRIILPVTLPNERALIEMFVALLETIDVDPHEGERAERLAQSFPSMFGAVSSLQDGAGHGSRKMRAKRPHAASENRPSKAQ
jgi:transcriptional regulator with XRE-family HTH domain